MLDIEVKLGRLDEMRAQYLLQPFGIHVLIEYIHVSQAVSTEACPSADLDWMRLFVHAIGRIQRLPLRPTNEHLAPETLTPEELFVRKLHLHPVVLCPVFVTFSGGQPVALLCCTEFPLVLSDAAKEAHLDESAIDSARGDIHTELATDAAGRGKLCLLRLCNDGCVLLCCGLSLATAARRVVRILLRQPVAYGAHVAGNARSDVGLVAALSMQHSDGDSLVMAEVAVGMRVVIEERLRRRGRRRRSDCCSCSGRVAVLLIMAVVALAAVFVLCCLPCSADGALELQMRCMNRREQAQQYTGTTARERMSIGEAYEVVVQLWICLLTLLELDMLSAADREPLTSLHTAQQQ